MGIIQEDPQKKVLLLYWLAITFLLIANGYYNIQISQVPELFWLIDFLTFVILPANAIAHLARIRNEKPIKTLEIFNFNQPLSIEWRAVCVILPASLIIIVIFRFNFWFLTWLFPNFAESFFNYGSLIPHEPVRRELAILYFSLSAAISEEIFFRAIPLFLVPAFHKNQITYILSTATIFSILHWEQGVSGLISTFLYGVIFATYYIRSRNLVHVAILHFFLNMILFRPLALSWIDYFLYSIFSVFAKSP